jgi:hypothetical protein
VQIKYFVLAAALILAGLGMYFFQANIIPVSMIVVWVFLVSAVFALGENIVGRR